MEPCCGGHALPEGRTNPEDRFKRQRRKEHREDFLFFALLAAFLGVVLYVYG